jgi:hypothetical protein
VKVRTVLEQLQKGEDLSVCNGVSTRKLVKCTVSRELQLLWRGDTLDSRGRGTPAVGSRYHKIDERQNGKTQCVCNELQTV